MKSILIATIFTFLNAQATDNLWKSHKTCFKDLLEEQGECQTIKFNDDKRINKNNKIDIQESKICKTSEFIFDFHFSFLNQKVTIPDVDIRKFLHRDFLNSSSNSCLRKMNMHLGEFNRKAKSFYSCSNQSQFFSKIQIINNCREAGNYEFKFFKNNTVVFKGHTLFSKTFYEDILLNYTKSHGGALDISDTFIGYTKARYFQSKTDRSQNKFYLSNPAPNFNELQSKNRCKIDQLKLFPRGSSISYRGSINVFSGEINYNEFENETKVKSGFKSSNEPMSYVRTPCKKDKNYLEQINLPAPVGLKRYSPYSNDKDAWLNSECQYVPYTFTHYNQFIIYNTAFSAFEVDGLYTGLRENGGNFSNSKGSRWNASLGHLRNLAYFELRNLSSNLKELRLINKVEGTSLLVGNIDLNKLRHEDLSFLMGYDSQKLVSDYNQNIFKTFQPIYSFAYNSNNDLVLNQHDLNKVGFEKIILRRDSNKLIIDLISHERIAPIWRGEIKVN